MLTVYELIDKTGHDCWRSKDDLAASLEELGYEVIGNSKERLTFYDPRESDNLHYILWYKGMATITISRLETDEA